MAIKILHTSDWHLGRTLYGRKRHEEFAAFLSWLGALIKKESINVLLVSGDIFDTAAPGVKAQELYYRFLSDTAAPGNCQIVVTAGNHDSPSFIDAPKGLLSTMNIHVVGSVSENPEEEIVIIKSLNKNMLIPEVSAELIVCAVPYLRDRDIRKVEPGESVEDKGRRLIEGIFEHYDLVCRAAEEVRKSCGTVPLVAMGHLFTTGGTVAEGDGVRELYAGSLAHVAAGKFSSGIDYLALGHLHSAQKAGGLEHIRYSGSPLPMSFGEAGSSKSVTIVSFDKGKGIKPDIKVPDITLIDVPVFQSLESIKGDLDTILGRLYELKEKGLNVWLEIEYTGESVPLNFRQHLDGAVENSNLDILRIRSKNRLEALLPSNDNELLEDLDVMEVFNRCMDTRGIEENHRPDLIQLYREALERVYADTGGDD